jgi:hypothetical protein
MQSKQELTPLIRIDVEKIARFILEHKSKRAWSNMDLGQIKVDVICAIARQEIGVIVNDKKEIEGVGIGHANHLYKVMTVDNWIATTRRARVELVKMFRQIWQGFDVQGERRDGLTRYKNTERFLHKLETI